jgi:hypothetical protein
MQANLKGAGCPAPAKLSFCKDENHGMDSSVSHTVSLAFDSMDGCSDLLNP